MLGIHISKRTNMFVADRFMYLLIDKYERYVYNWISLSFIYKCNNQTKNSFKIEHISSNSTKSCKKVKKIISDFNFIYHFFYLLICLNVFIEWQFGHKAWQFFKPLLDLFPFLWSKWNNGGIFLHTAHLCFCFWSIWFFMDFEKFWRILYPFLILLIDRVMPMRKTIKTKNVILLP